MNLEAKPSGDDGTSEFDVAFLYQSAREAIGILTVEQGFTFAILKWSGAESTGNPELPGEFKVPRAGNGRAVASIKVKRAGSSSPACTVRGELLDDWHTTSVNVV